MLTFGNYCVKITYSKNIRRCISMDMQFEKKICLNFFKKCCQERLIYELGNIKKRRNFYDKIAHTSDLYLKNECIIQCNFMPVCIKEIKSFFNKEECYFMCLNAEFDGTWCLIDYVIEKIWSNGTPYIIVNKDCTKAYLEEEYDFSVHKSFLLINN